MQQRGNQRDFLGFCESVPMADQGARADLIREQQRKLREIEEQLDAVQRSLRRLPAALSPVPPTQS